MGFSSDWLALREAADHRSRASDLAERVGAKLASKEINRVVDLGSGTGSNLRATAPFLANAQEWTLVDYDFVLLEEAARVLTAWADEAKAIGDQLVLVKGEKTIGVKFRIADLNEELESVLSGKPDLVTASALFDLISEPWMARFAKAIAAQGTLFYTVLTYDGRDVFAPAHPLDEAMIGAFATHQQQDKGFGVAAGPRAAAALVGALRKAGYSVDVADSPWELTRADARLKTELLKGFHGAVAETGLVPLQASQDWLAARLTAVDQADSRLITGHTDIFAHQG